MDIWWRRWIMMKDRETLNVWLICGSRDWELGEVGSCITHCYPPPLYTDRQGHARMSWYQGYVPVMSRSNERDLLPEPISGSIWVHLHRLGVVEFNRVVNPRHLPPSLPGDPPAHPHITVKLLNSLIPSHVWCHTRCRQHCHPPLKRYNWLMQLMLVTKKECERKLKQHCKSARWPDITICGLDDI